MLKKKLTTITAVTMSALLIGGNSTFANDEKTAEEVLKQANEAMENLESFSSTSDLHQVISDDVSGEMEIHTEIEQDVILDPFKLRQIVTTSLPEGGEETLTSYWTEDGYFQEDHEGGWLKISDGSEDLDQMAHHPSHQLDEMEGLSGDLNLSEEGNYYVVTYNGDGDELANLMNQAMNDGMNDEDKEMMEEMMADTEVNDFSYEIFIDMDTYYLSKMNLELDMEIHVEGETTSMEQMLEMSFYNFDSVEDFDIPQEVIEEAKDIEEVIDEAIEEAEEGDELPATATNNPMMAVGGLLLAITAGGILFVRRRTEQA